MLAVHLIVRGVADMHERGPFFVDNGILFINGTQVHDLASILDTTTGELLACGDYDNDNLQQVFSDAFKRYVSKGQREHAHSLMIVHYNEQDFKNLDSVCSIANYELACDDKEKLKEIAFAKSTELERRIPAFQRQGF